MWYISGHEGALSALMIPVWIPTPEPEDTVWNNLKKEVD